MKYIDAEKLIATLERQNVDKKIIQPLIRIIDSLQQEQPSEDLEAETSYDTQQYTPRPSVDIGDVARVQFAAHAKVFDKKRKAVFDWEQFKEVAGIFYGFGKKDSLKTEEREQPCEDLEEAADAYEEQLGYYECMKQWPKVAFKAGAEWAMEQVPRWRKMRDEMFYDDYALDDDKVELRFKDTYILLSDLEKLPKED